MTGKFSGLFYKRKKRQNKLARLIEKNEHM